ncbi:hypothetical protein R1sor_015676 [Riccia sorocarpa]|uniref:SWIM-type domain-containing protein n=1 Tax=Riccia sorocarpa TaxID=122646 RepID=A0ABD3HFY5_9MARC
MLTKKVTPFYYCASELKQQGQIRNRIVASLVVAAICKTREIPMADVISYASEGGMKVSLVRSQSRQSYLHEVRSWDTDFCRCTCGFSVQRNACKHQIRCLLLVGYSEVDLLHMLGTKWDTNAGDMHNMQPIDALGNIEMANVSLPIDVAHLVAYEDDEDCVMLSSPSRPEVHIMDEVTEHRGESQGRKQRMLADFQREVAKLFKEVSGSSEISEVCIRPSRSLPTSVVRDSLIAMIRMDIVVANRELFTLPIYALEHGMWNAWDLVLVRGSPPHRLNTQQPELVLVKGEPTTLAEHIATGA